MCYKLRTPFFIKDSWRSHEFVAVRATSQYLLRYGRMATTRPNTDLPRDYENWTSRARSCTTPSVIYRLVLFKTVSQLHLRRNPFTMDMVLSSRRILCKVCSGCLSQLRQVFVKSESSVLCLVYDWILRKATLALVLTRWILILQSLLGLKLAFARKSK